MSEMVERVARAIAAATLDMYREPNISTVSFEKRWQSAAEAAIEAMREPTPTMCQARGDMSDEDWLRVMPQDVWKSMIDEALK